MAYPWQQSQWQRLNQLEVEQRLPHALVLAGPEGTGKRRFAQALAYRLLCDAPVDGQACGHCAACGYLRAGTHPDLQWLEPDEGARQIKVDQIRHVVEYLNKKSQLGGRRIIVIRPAEAMNRSAANGLLKSLEEPGEGALLILVCQAASRLIPTIRSRCQVVTFPVPAFDAALQWVQPVLQSDAEPLLRQAGGRPLLALRFSESDAATRHKAMTQQWLSLQEGRASSLQVAGLWQEYPVTDVLEWLLGLVSRSIKQSMVSSQEGGWQTRQSDVQEFYRVYDTINEAITQLAGGLNPNLQLLLENILMSCATLPKLQK